MDVFSVLGNEYFKVLTSKYQNIFIDCLEIIYNSYRTELSYGIDREILLLQLTDYFDNSNSVDIQFDEETEIIKDPRAKAAEFLRKLKAYGWIEFEYGNDNRQKIIMPNHSVTIMQALISITETKEMEYQSEISAIYSLLVNEKLIDRPYPQIIKPTYDRTLALFTELKKLNTGIRKYIDELTDGKTPEEIMEHFFSYNENIGSKAYHRMKTNDNVSRFRNTIESRLRDILNDKEIMERAVLGYQNIENENDRDVAKDKVIEMIVNVIGYFDSYDELEKEIVKKHTKYLKSAVSRAKLAFMNSNNIEGKISTILRMLAKSFNAEEDNSIYDDVPECYCRIFNMFPQGYLSEESLKPIPVVKKICDIDDIFDPQFITEELLEKRKQEIKNRQAHRFSRKNINIYVNELLKDKSEIRASEINASTRRDLIRLIFISMYGKDKKSGFITESNDMIISENGFTFNDFTIKRRVK